MTELETIIEKLGLSPHPEGGYYRRTYCNEVRHDGRGAASAIYFLLEGGTPSLWHRTDGDELWFWHMGAALKLDMCEDGSRNVATTILGPSMVEGHIFQTYVPANQWQRAESVGEWTLVSCAVSPEFLFDSYELIQDASWMPGDPVPS